MTAAFDQALEDGATTRIHSLSVTFTPRGQTTGQIGQVSPDSITFQATRSSTPTATATLTFTNPEWDWTLITPTNDVLTRASIFIEQQADLSPAISNLTWLYLWVTDVVEVKTDAGTEVTVTAVSADWILTNHRFKNDIRREVLNRDVDNFWYTRFQRPATGEGLDSGFQEFVNMISGLTAASPGAPSGPVWIPLAAESTLWDVAAALAGHWEGYWVAGLVKPGTAPSSWTVNQPAVTLAPFADDSVLATDLRMSTGRNFRSETRVHPDWAERILHTRRWSEGQGAGSGALEFSETTAYGEPETDLRPQLAHETWGSEENPAAMEALLARVRNRKLQTFLETRLDFDLWLGYPVLTDEGFRWISSITWNVEEGTMQLELTEEIGEPRLNTWETMPMDTGSTWASIDATQWQTIGY